MPGMTSFRPEEDSVPRLNRRVVDRPFALPAAQRTEQPTIVRYNAASRSPSFFRQTERTNGFVLRPMTHLFRRAFPLIALAGLLTALAWAMSFGTLPPADFTFHNGDEAETIDPARATGQPENRIINGLFDGLL